MPQTPPRLTVARTRLPALPRPSGPQTPPADAYGRAVGEAVMGTARLAERYYQAELAKQTRLRLTKAETGIVSLKHRLLNGWTDETGQEHPGILSVEGEDALGLSMPNSKFLKQYDEEVRRYRDTLPTEVARAAFDAVALQHREDLLTKAREHEHEQLDIVEKRTLTEHLGTLESEAVSDFRNTAKVDELIERGIPDVVELVRPGSAVYDNLRFLQAHEDVPWVRRLLDADQRRLDLGNGSWATHQMAAEVIEDWWGEGLPKGKWAVFPTVYPKNPDDPNSPLVQAEDLRTAIQEAVKRGNMVIFDSKEKALRFAEGGYKLGTYLDDGSTPKSVQPRTKEEKHAVAVWRSGIVRRIVMAYLDENDLDGAEQFFEARRKWVIDDPERQDLTAITRALTEARKRRETEAEAARIVDLWEKGGYDPTIIDEELKKLPPERQPEVLRAIQPRRRLAEEKRQQAEREQMDALIQRAAKYHFDLHAAFTDGEWTSLSAEQQSELLLAAQRFNARMAMGGGGGGTREAAKVGLDADEAKELERVDRKFARWYWITDPRSRARDAFFSEAELQLLARIDPAKADIVRKWQSSWLKGVGTPNIKDTDEKVLQVAIHYGIIDKREPGSWTPKQTDMMSEFTYRVNKAIEEEQERKHDKLSRTEIEKIIDEVAGQTIKMWRDGFLWMNEEKEIPIAFLTPNAPQLGENWYVEIEGLSDEQLDIVKDALMPYAQQFHLLPEDGKLPDDPEEAGRILRHTLKTLVDEGRLSGAIKLMQDAKRRWKVEHGIAVAIEADKGYYLPAEKRRELNAILREMAERGATERMISAKIASFARANRKRISRENTKAVGVSPSVAALPYVQKGKVPVVDEDFRKLPSRQEIDDLLSKEYLPQWDRVSKETRLRVGVHSAKDVGQSYDRAREAEEVLDEIDQVMRHRIIPAMSVAGITWVQRAILAIQQAKGPDDLRGILAKLRARAAAIEENPQEAIRATEEEARSWWRQRRPL